MSECCQVLPLCEMAKALRHREFHHVCFLPKTERKTLFWKEAGSDSAHTWRSTGELRGRLSAGGWGRTDEQTYVTEAGDPHACSLRDRGSLTKAGCLGQVPATVSARGCDRTQKCWLPPLPPGLSECSEVSQGSKGHAEKRGCLWICLGIRNPSDASIPTPCYTLHSACPWAQLPKSMACLKTLAAVHWLLLPDLGVFSSPISSQSLPHLPSAPGNL